MPIAVCVLVVEDEPLVRVDIADQLTDEGFHVLEAGNADQAIAAIEANPAIKLIFTDVDMPGSMDGLTLARFVSQNWPPVRIIVTSGHRIADLVDIPDGSVFFAKPYHHQTVVTAMREMLSWE